MKAGIVIIGAGPTGLGAAYRLKELGHESFHLYDSNAQMGGLASSFTDEQGFAWDIGGHVMFSHYDYYDRVFDALMGSDYQLNMRESWVRMLDQLDPISLSEQHPLPAAGDRLQMPCGTHQGADDAGS